MTSVADLLRAHEDALAFMSKAIAGVPAGTWSNPSPCDEWTVRDVANHIVSENLWAEPLMEGKTVEEVGDRFDGDVLGADPVAAWNEAAKVASAAFNSEKAIDRMVHVSWGDIPGRLYLEQMTSDLVIHGWDILKGSGQDDRIPENLVALVTELTEAAVKSGATASVFKPPVEVGPGADAQTKLLALTGRAR